MEVFVEGPKGSANHAVFFEASDGSSDAPLGTYLYVSSISEERILWHACVSKNVEPGLQETDIQILWSRDGTKCGAVIRGRMRAVINVNTGVEFESCSKRESEGSAWERDFDEYLDVPIFLRARQLYWKRMADPEGGELPETEAATSKFVRHERCNGLAAVFEDDGETGYLYLYDRERHSIRDHVQAYDDSLSLGVLPRDVKVIWASACSKCAISIFGAIRAIIDVRANRTGRAKLTNRSSAGIADKAWLSGFTGQHSR